MSIYKEQRVGVLVDIQNLYYSAKVLYSKKVNFGNVLKDAVGDRKLIRAIAYGIKTLEGQEEKFFEALEKVGYEVKTKDLQIFPGGAKKGDWDVGIAVDAIKMSKSLDAIVLISGDGDYIPLVKYIQSTTGCRVEGMAFGESTSNKLVEELDDFTNLSENKKKFLINA
ncbi:MAG: NYN domain-containing protein [Parcubacteria group bacterium]